MKLLRKTIIRESKKVPEIQAAIASNRPRKVVG